MYGHIRRTYTFLANPMYFMRNLLRNSSGMNVDVVDAVYCHY
jgi:hypothetical protein